MILVPNELQCAKRISFGFRDEPSQDQAAAIYAATKGTKPVYVSFVGRLDISAKDLMEVVGRPENAESPWYSVLSALVCGGKGV